MTPLLTRRVRQLADTIAELKVKVRAALATELAGAVGNAIRDVLVATMLDRLVGVAQPAHSPSRERNWRDGEYEYDCEREQWDEPRDPWAEGGDRDRLQTRYELGEPVEEKSPATIPAAAAVAVGVNVGRWWFLKKGSLVAAVGVGAIATTLGLAGGPVARAVLTVLTTATDVLAAETILARADPT
jgi:hypothetical protein